MLSYYKMTFSWLLTYKMRKLKILKFIFFILFLVADIALGVLFGISTNEDCVNQYFGDFARRTGKAKIRENLFWINIGIYCFKFICIAGNF